MSAALKLRALVAFVSLASACKPSATSSVRTLDNFAADATVHQNFCGASAAVRQAEPARFILADRVVFDDVVARDPGRLRVLKDEVIASLTAVPPNIQKMFLAMDGFVYVRGDVGQICSEAAEGEGAASCFRFGQDPDGVRARVLDIYVAPSEPAIRHGLLRQFAFVYTQFLARLRFDGIRNGVPSYTFLEESQPLLDAKLAVADAYLDDLNDQSLFPAPRFSGDSSGAKAVSAIADYIFAEAFDSYYCNDWGTYDTRLAETIRAEEAPLSAIAGLPNTRRLMADFFPGTYRAFKAAALSLKLESSTVGLALQDDVTSSVEAGGIAGIAGGGSSETSEGIANEAQQYLFSADDSATRFFDQGAQLMNASTQPAELPDWNFEWHPMAREIASTSLNVVPDAIRKPGGWYGGESYVDSTGSGILRNPNDALFQKGLYTAPDVAVSATPGASVRIIDKNFIPLETATGVKIGAVGADGLNYFSEPGLGQGADIANWFASFGPNGTPTATVLTGGDGRMPGEPGPYGRTARLETVIGIDEHGVCTATSRCGESHQRMQAAVAGSSVTMASRETAPVTETFGAVPNAHAVDLTTEGTYPFDMTGAAPAINRRVGATVGEGPVPGSREIKYMSQSDAFPGRDQYVETVGRDGTKRLYLVGGQLPDSSGPGPVSLTTMGSYREQRFTVYPDGRVFANGKPLPEVQPTYPTSFRKK